MNEPAPIVTVTPPSFGAGLDAWRGFLADVKAAKLPEADWRYLVPDDVLDDLALRAAGDAINLWAEDTERDEHGHWVGGGAGKDAAKAERRDKQREARQAKKEAKAKRVARAKATYRPATRANQQRAYESERMVTGMVGGKNLPDNEPMDIITTHAGAVHGVEVKTFIDQKNDKVTCHKESRERKERWAKANKATLHTVIIDRRNEHKDPAIRKLYSGHRVYYYRGVGSPRINMKGVTKVTSASHLRALMGIKR